MWWSLITRKNRRARELLESLKLMVVKIWRKINVLTVKKNRTLKNWLSKAKKRESKSESKIVMTVGNDSDSFDYSFSITPIVCYSEKSEWIIDTSATYHVCPKREWVASFEKLDRGLLTFGEGHTFHIEGISIVRIKLFDRMIRELKDIRYVPQLKKNLISVETLKAQGLRGTLGEGVLKMSSDSLIVLKGIRRNNLY